MRAKSHNYEFYFYGFVWTTAVLYGTYKVSIATLQFYSDYTDNYHDFTEGWYFLDKKKDISDIELTTILENFIKLLPWIILHVIITEICYLFKPSVVPTCQIIISFLCILYLGGIFVLSLLLIQPITFALLFKLKKKGLITWALSSTFLICIHLFKYEEYLHKFHVNLGFQHFVLTSTLCWINLRCISISLDDTQQWSHYLWYTMYLPSLCVGPIVPYTDFFKRNRKVKFEQRLKRLILNLCRFIGWMIFTEFCLHFIYVNALEFQEKFVATFDSWTLYGYGYTMGQYFHLKYVIVYGISTTLMKFEGINAPDTPKCIGRIHLYSDMWKYFDQGLYWFLTRYIYIPLNKRYNLPILATFFCFTFVFIWHGLQDFVFVWSFLNFLGIVIERSCTYISTIPIYISIATSIGTCTERRILCSLSAFLLAMSCISNFYFFAGMGIGNIFVHRIFSDSFLSSTILFIVLYCCCQISTELRIQGIKRVTKVSMTNTPYSDNKNLL